MSVQITFNKKNQYIEFVNGFCRLCKENYETHKLLNNFCDEITIEDALCIDNFNKILHVEIYNSYIITIMYKKRINFYKKERHGFNYDLKIKIKDNHMNSTYLQNECVPEYITSDKLYNSLYALDNKYLNLLLSDFLLKHSCFNCDEILLLFNCSSISDFYENSYLLELFKEKEEKYKSHLEIIEGYTKNPDFNTNFEMIKECADLINKIPYYEIPYNSLNELIKEYFCINSTKSARKL